MIYILITSLLINIYFIIKTLKRKKMEQDQLILTFYKGDNNRTIAKTTQGKVCMLDIAYCKENNIYVKWGEDWRCAISKEMEHKIIVQPITRTLTAEQNQQLFDQKATDLKKKFDPVGRRR